MQASQENPKSITFEDIERLLENDERVKVAGLDIDGVLRGKILVKSKFLSTLKSGFGFCSVLFGWDLHDKVYTEPGVEFAAEATGYPDIIARVDLSTFRRIPWEDNVPFFLLTFYDPKSPDEPLYCCPRGLLQGVLQGYKELGLEPYAGAEFEFFNFKETPETLAAKNHIAPFPLTPGMFGYSLLRPTLNQDFYYDIFDSLQKFGVQIEGWHTETAPVYNYLFPGSLTNTIILAGPGVYEAAIAYTSALEAADRAALFKTSVKQLGILRHGVVPSFMAKPHNNLPGCSGHLHFSIREVGTGQNVFAAMKGKGEEQSKFADVTVEMSGMMRSFLAGVLKGLPSCMAVLAPTINSYKRLVENYWAPVTVSWGIDNRIAAVRVIAPPVCSPSATRMEVRVTGADINPHLAIATILACGLWGIHEKLTIPIAPLGHPASEGKGERLARSLAEAILKMDDAGSVARKVLGDRFVNHFVKTRRHEWSAWESAVTEWEVRRYMELI
ncbi:hypothetical protein BC938DRAFT_473838 [Jimgerdemannia flammicorona]|uniref:Glutamine synthetase n=1 Tax=Jimgerdemannia flammicorona TaxID=994334 RepID=A0A433Q3H5_9FUNG|nr:hypothetical protein BC938DRAFT_473838 [Jimgerdemannia flammicorona]